MKRLIGIVIAVTTVATPTFAQNYGTGYSTGRNTVAAPARLHSRAIHRQVADPIYAMSPRANSYGGYPYSDNTGGGSPGYNEMLMNW